MRLAGDDLTAARDINFSVLFDKEANAEAYAADMREAGFEVQVDECIEVYEVPAWEAVTTAHIVPSYERITALGNLIRTIAASHDGVPDAWASDYSETQFWR